MTDYQTKSGAARLSVVSNTLLVALKLAVGAFTGSVSVLSEAIHSAVDLAAALIAFFSVQAADRPADEQHPFGHGKIENVSALVEAVLIFVAAGYLVYEAVHRLAHPPPVRGLEWAMLVMLISAVANWLISRHLLRVAAATDSPALLADAHHLRVDVYTSAGVLAALALIQLTGLRLLDPLIALGVAALIFRVAWSLTQQAGGSLLDETLPSGEQQRLKHVLESETRVLGYHRVRARKSGSQRHIDLHLLVDPELSLREAHQLAEKVEDDIRAAFPGAWVISHVEPATDEELAVQEGEPGIWKGRAPEREGLPRGPQETR